MEISISTLAFSEADGNRDFVVTLSAPSAGTITVDYRTIDGTAFGVGGGRDYDRKTGTLTFDPGETSKVVRVFARGDALDETDEFFWLELHRPTGGGVLAGGGDALRAIGWILDNDGSADDRALAVSDPFVIEGDAGQTQARFEVFVSQAFGTTTQLDYATADGTAAAGTDYDAASGQVLFGSSQTRAEVVVQVNGDAAPEAAERFSLLVSPNAAVFSGAAGAAGEATIQDDDAAEMTISAADAAFVERDGNHPFIVTLSKPSAGTVSVGYRVDDGSAVGIGGGRDFDAKSGTLTFAPGETSKEINVFLRGDTADETDETILLHLFDADGGAKLAGGADALTAVGWILDEDGSAEDLGLHVSSPTLVEGDAGTRKAVFELRLSDPSTTAITLDWETRDGDARAGEDYAAASGSVVFEPGQTFASVTVDVIGDGASETAERFSLAVTPAGGIDTGPVGAVGQATILDDDAAPTTIAIGDRSFVEADGNQGFVVRLSQASAGSVSVDYRTIDGTANGAGSPRDFDAKSGTLTFAPGETYGIINVFGRSDAIDEIDEHFFVELSNPTGAVLAGARPTARAIGWVLDNDGSANDRAVALGEATGHEAGARPAVFPVHLSRPAETDVTVTPTLFGRTATKGVDFSAAAAGAVFAPGQTFAAISVGVTDDKAAEAPSETFLLDLAVAGDVFNPGGVSADGVIVDDDQPTQGDDRINGSAAADRIDGLGGNDVINGLGGGDKLFGGPGADTVSGGDGADEIKGGDGADTLDGNQGDDQLEGENDADLLRGGPGNDRLLGGGGPDRLFGGPGVDKMFGGAANDLLRGGSGADALDGGDGDDQLYGEGQSDKLFGGDGRDRMFGGGGDDFFDGGSGNDRMLGQGGKDRMFGGSGNDALDGGGGKDRLVGGVGNDALSGGGGADALEGSAGRDQLFGGGGNDVLDGGGGNDLLNGGGGRDMFRFARGSGDDRIKGFADGRDDIDLSGYRGVDGMRDIDIVQLNNGALVKMLGGDSIFVEGVDADDLGRGDFIF